VSTLSERILGAPAGTYVDREVDLAFAHDGTGILTREALREMAVSGSPTPIGYASSLTISSGKHRDDGDAPGGAPRVCPILWSRSL